jgi:hypothetical protein
VRDLTLIQVEKPKDRIQNLEYKMQNTDKCAREKAEREKKTARKRETKKRETK